MRVLLTGLGSIGSRHARLLAEHPRQVELLAYRSGPGRGGDHVMDVESYTDLDRALDANPDVAFITNPTHLHVETALQCARANCHLFLEKPLSNTLEGVDELIETVEERELITMMGCQLRFDPVLQRAKELLAANDLGAVHSFRAYSGSYLPEWRPDQDYRTSYSADPKRGGGVVLDLVHELDYVYWLFGRPTRVSAELAHVDTLEIDSEAIAEILLRCQDDVIGSVHLDYCRRQSRRTFEVNCEAGALVGDLVSGSLTIERQSGPDTEVYEVERDGRFRTQLSYFLDHVDGEEPCENDVREGKAVLEIALETKGERSR